MESDDVECIDITNNEVDVNNAVIAVKAFKTEVEITAVRPNEFAVWLMQLTSET